MIIIKGLPEGLTTRRLSLSDAEAVHAAFAVEKESTSARPR